MEPYTQSNRLLLISIKELFPLLCKQPGPGKFCIPNDPWSFAASHSRMYMKNRSIWNLSEHYEVLPNILICIGAIDDYGFATATHLCSCSFIYVGVPCKRPVCVSCTRLCLVVWIRQYNAYILHYTPYPGCRVLWTVSDSGLPADNTKPAIVKYANSWLKKMQLRRTVLL